MLEDDELLQALATGSGKAGSVNFAEVKRNWIAAGLLARGPALGDAWGDPSLQTLEQAEASGELFSLVVNGAHWYPAAFTKLPAATVGVLCQALEGVDPVSKVIFWTRPHGALGAKTLEQAVEAGQLARALQITEAFAAEYRGQPATD